MGAEQEILRIEFMPDGSIIRYQFGYTKDCLSVPLSHKSSPVHTYCTRFPGDTSDQISRIDAIKIIRRWRKEALEVIIVDHRNAVQSVMLPSGIELTRNSNLLLLAKAFQQYQRGDTHLAQADADALRLWIADRVPFGIEAVDKIQNMTALDGLESI